MPSVCRFVWHEIRERSRWEYQIHDAPRIRTGPSHKTPSLIYLIDEDNQPVLPKDVEFGPGAEKLRSLKETLKRQHTVSFFTTPESLRAGILHDVPELLKSIGAEVGDELDFEAAQSDAETLEQFRTLPKMFAGRPVIIEFVNRSSFHSAYPDAIGDRGHSRR